MDLCFILYKPAVAGNIGAAARAIKTMGFSELRLIQPCDHLADEARMLAHGSNEILERAGVFDDFPSAIKDVDFLVGTTAKKRSAHEDYISPADLREILHSKKDSIGKCAFVFGTEESGLPNDILEKCDLASTIPLKDPYPSLNLGQSVMLYAYEFSSYSPEKKAKQPTSGESYIELKNRVKKILHKSGIHEDFPLYNRIMERLALVSSEDINLLHSTSSRIDKTIDKKSS